jgi:2',3'-cyclic-nucleotide 2'-phosphodiesterase (5'-nucleotidase family)
MAQELDFAAEYPQFDLVIGGHSHDLCTKQLEDGVLYTQSKYYLKAATVTKMKFADGKIIEKEAQVIDFKTIKKVDEKIQKKVEEYYAEPEFQKVIGHAKTPFNDKDALGAYMADAQRYITKADIAMQNPGGVRFDNMHGGDITKADIYNLDPFNNSLVITEMTGKQVEDFLAIASTKDRDCTHVSGITYTIDYLKTNDDGHFSNAKAFINGKRIDQNKVYTVTMNSYMALWAQGNCIKIKDSDMTCNDAEFLYLENHKDIDYQGVKRYECDVIHK